MITAIELEKFIVHGAREDEAPEEARRILEKESADRVPTAISYHPDHGWFVIQTSGKGPYIIWKEESTKK
jgi:hypothetical protein